ncbi:MAG: sulfurtransferase-like selenium metabolism protein YedF [Candidatus Wallbacteria bacterium]
METESFYFNILKESTSVIEEKFSIDIRLDSSCLLVTKNYFGDTDNQLSQSLIKSFFYVMAEKDTKPSEIILINKGVLLATEGSSIISALKELERDGVSLLCCGASLNHLKMREKLQTGYISNMYDIIEVLMQSKKVITI